MQRRSSSAIGYNDENYAEDAAILSYLGRDSQVSKADNRYGWYRWFLNNLLYTKCLTFFTLLDSGYYDYYTDASEPTHKTDWNF